MKGELMGAELFERVLHATSISERRWRQHMRKRVLSSNPIYQLGESDSSEEEEEYNEIYRLSAMGLIKLVNRKVGNFSTEQDEVAEMGVDTKLSEIGT
jgi:hypothetical protein